jgi:hypothetical protein
VRKLRRTLQRTGGAPGLLALVCLLAGAAISRAQSPMSAEVIEKMRKTKAPEEWTVEERLAVRFDPGDISRRRQADREQLLKTRAELPEIAAAQASPPDAGDTSNSVVGQRNPELFLPIELFDSLLKGAFPPQSLNQQESRDSYHSVMQGALEAAGFNPGSFWRDLEGIAKVPIQADKEFYKLAEMLGHAKPSERATLVKRSEEIAVSMCGPRAAALAAAREHFGKAFERFLYRGVAPTMFQLLSPDPEWENQLRRREEGCHAPGQ